MEKSQWALATVRENGSAVACIERDGRLFRLEASLARVGWSSGNSVVDLFTCWGEAEGALSRAVELLDETDCVVGPRLAPLIFPGKVLCAGANYFDHLAEMGMPDARKEEQRLFFFFKPAKNAVVGEGATVHMPIGTNAFDWEIELAAVIGRSARNVDPETALAHVGAYTVAIDLSARDHNSAPNTFYKLDWVAGKANDTCCPMGPRLVPASAIEDPQNLRLTLSVNGVTKQDARTSGMIFTIAEQIAKASRIMTLDPGDVILTGTPAGVGMPRNSFLTFGDRIDAEIESIGTLSVTIQPPAL